MNDFSKMSKAELQSAIQEYHRTQTQAAPLQPLQRPKELDDVNTPAPLRAAIREQYCSGLMDRKSETWSASDRALMGEHLAFVMKGLGF